MSPEAFAYWLQGWMEVGQPKVMNEQEVETIKSHLKLVLTNVTATPGRREVMLKEMAERLKCGGQGDGLLFC